MLELIGIVSKVCGIAHEKNSVESSIFNEEYRIEGGIAVLRGYAKARDLAKYSCANEQYQRLQNDEHTKDINHFVAQVRGSAKFLPEVVLSIRDDAADFKPQRDLKIVDSVGKIKVSDKEMFKKFNLYALNLRKENTLSRIDGNHRLEALKNSDTILSFVIILGDVEYPALSQDDEAFLFYFLNSKAKKLTTEENFKGLVNSKTWTDSELKEANKHLSFLKEFNFAFSNDGDFHKTFGSEPLKSIYEVLEKLDFSDEEDFMQCCKEAVKILDHRRCFKYLRNNFSHFLPQLSLIAVNQSKDKNFDSAYGFFEQMDGWLEKYGYDEDYFACPLKMYQVVRRALEVEEIDIFVAMPYYNKDRVEAVNVVFKTLVKELVEENFSLKNKLKVCDIMTNKGESKDINQTILNQIKHCKIFVADISNHKKSLANPNVMYELGLAQSLNKKIILLKNKKDIKGAPFDIISKYRHEFDSEAINVDMAKKCKDDIKTILEQDFGIIFNKKSSN